ncbi:hypothetical protein AcW1_003373 [Taiwanofungus camphoratus]|nr:hypothetical protein AcW1_003373 [Antrodia cinnamomea]
MGDSTDRDIYMSILALRGEKEESFEERRVRDYIHAHRTTGRPPMPSPLEPASSEERAALGLPPLFVPFSEVITYPANEQSNGITQGDPRGGVSSASDVQVFRPYTGRDDNPRMFCVYYSIVCQPEFRAFSFEELRYAAYSKGLKIVPRALNAQATSATALPHANGVAESFQSIYSESQYQKHSFEELRLAFLRSDRQLNSAEIIEQNSVLKLT